jgi:formylglycine-generating enzyme required for sulfatase activity
MARFAGRLIALALLIVAVVLIGAGCSNPAPAQSNTQAPPTQASSGANAPPTAVFKIEMQLSPTPTIEVSEGTAAPTPTPGPTNTPRPTKTTWPTQAPTSAPAEDEGMVYVPGGEFIFGRDGGPEDESPEQVVQVAGFNIDKYPVTNADYKVFVDATGHREPRHWKEGQIPEGKEDHPVVWVSWEDATAYAQWAGKRLPTEVEWEMAARGIEGWAYPWGNDFDSAKCNSAEAGLGDTSPVGAYPEGVSPYGAEDMCGNVMEWTTDWYAAYRGSLYTNERYGETHKVLRGGSWFDPADAVRTTTRKSAKPDFRFSTIGFRCAK